MIDVPEIDTFGSTRDRKIRVREAPGFLASVDVISQIPLSVDAAFELLTHPDNHKVFRSILQRYEVTHVTGWKVLWFKGEFRTRLRIDQDKHKGSVNFKLLESDIMDAFDGRWEIQPCTQRSLDKLYGRPVKFNPFAGVTDLLASKQHRCLIEFEQKIQPKKVPPALSGLARRIAANAMKTTLEDVDREANLIEKGASTIPDLNRFATANAPKSATTKASAPLASVSSAYSIESQRGRSKRSKHRSPELHESGPHQVGTRFWGRSASPFAAQQIAGASSSGPSELLGCGLWRASLGNLITV